MPWNPTLKYFSIHPTWSKHRIWWHTRCLRTPSSTSSMLEDMAVEPDSDDKVL